MNFSFFIAKKVFRNTSNSFSSLIIKMAIGSVAFSVAVMIIASSLINGFQKEISEKIFGFWGHVHIFHFESNQSFETKPISTSQAFYKENPIPEPIHYNDDIKVFGHAIGIQEEQQTHGGVKHIQMFANKAGILKTKRQFDGIVLKGVSADYDWTFLKDYIVAGDTLSLQSATNSDEIIISKRTAERLKLAVNDPLRVHFIDGEKQRIRSFKVKGIYNTGLEDYDKRFAIVDIRIIQGLNGWTPDQVGGFEVILDDIRDLDAIGDYLNYNTVGLDLFAQTIKHIDENIFGWLDLQDLNKQVILFLMLIVAIMNVATALLILILERTNMIGSLKALGANNWQVQKVFLYYAFLILVAGLVIGNVVGIGLSLLQKWTKAIPLPEEAYYLAYAPIDIDWIGIAWLNAAIIVITLVVLLLPSLIVMKISPVKSLRFK